MNSLTKLHPKSGGFSLVEFVVAIGVLTIIGLGAIYVSILSAKAKKSNTARSTAENIRYLFETNVNGSLAWKQTVPLNPAMDCVADSSIACDNALVGVLTPFKLCLIKTDSTCDIYDPSEVTADGQIGIDNLGKICHGYSDINGSDACPYHYDIAWQPICPTSGACKGPGVRVRGSFKYSPGTVRFPLNVNAFTFDTMRPPPPTTLKSVCDAAGGTFDVKTNFCQIAGVNTASQSFCPIGQQVVSINTDGSVNCDPVYTDQCLPGQVVGSINSSGQIQCVVNPCPVLDVDCQGSWSACSAGLMTYTVTTLPKGKGALCPFPSGTQMACGAALPCMGSWSPCAGGVRTYSVTSYPQNGGAACPFADGQVQACTDCVGAWSACNSGTITYSITTPALNSGAACPAANGDVRICPAATKTNNMCDVGKLGPAPGVTVMVPCQ